MDGEVVKSMMEKNKFYSYGEIAGRMLSPAYLSHTGNGERSAEFSSYDRASRFEEGEYLEWNANADGGGYIRETEDGGRLIAEMEGAGYISRIWSARADQGHVRIYIDEEETPTFDLPFEDYFNGKVFPFYKLCYTAARGLNCYVPITFNKSCRVVAYEGWGAFYQINYTMLPEGSEVERVSFPLSKSQAKAVRRVNEFFKKSIGLHPDQIEDAEFESFTVSGGKPITRRLEGCGEIASFLVRIPSINEENKTAPETVRLFKDLRLRMYWDEETVPSVDAPLGDFFGSCYGMDEVRTLLYGVREDLTLYSYFRMPYQREAVIEIVSHRKEETELSLSVTTLPREDTEAPMRFHALFNTGRYSLVKNRYPDFIFLKTQGCGRFVGVSLHVSQITSLLMPRSVVGWNWWGEGDEKFFVDGEGFPSWFGTGTEDFFGYAWCCPTLFSESYHAQSCGVGKGHGKGNRSFTRLLMGDSVPFSTSFEGCL